MHHTEKEDCSKKVKILKERIENSKKNLPQVTWTNLKILSKIGRNHACISFKKTERENENSGGTTILDNKCNFCFLKDPMIVI